MAKLSISTVLKQECVFMEERSLITLREVTGIVTSKTMQFTVGAIHPVIKDIRILFIVCSFTPF